MAHDPISAALNVGGKLIDRLWPDPAQRDRAKLELLSLAQQGDLAEFTGKVQIISTEAASSHWLAANWRPIVMLTFAGLIVARWLGWAAPDLSESEYLKLWSIVELGLGGYVIGRTGEKVVDKLADAYKESRK